MSFGRTLANIVTLGLWSFTDPDIEEFWKPIKGYVLIRHSVRRKADVDTIMEQFKWLKKDWMTDSKPVEVKSYKDSDALCVWLNDQRSLFYSKEGLDVSVWTPMNKAYKLLKSDDKNPVYFTRDGHTIHCKECGGAVAYGPKKRKHHKCKQHPKAGVFAVTPAKAPEHEYVMFSGSYYGSRLEEWEEWDDFDDD